MTTISFLSRFLFHFILSLSLFLKVVIYIYGDSFTVHTFGSTEKEEKWTHSTAKQIYGDDDVCRSVWVWATKNVQNKNNSIKLNEFIIYGKKSYVSRKQKRAQTQCCERLKYQEYHHQSECNNKVLSLPNVCWVRRREQRRQQRRRRRAAAARTTEWDGVGTEWILCVCLS